MNKKSLPKSTLTIIILFLLAMPTAYGSTTLVNGVYRVNENASFQIYNSGSNHFLFTWGSRSDIVDPTLELYVGKKYSFERITSAHPFAITKNLPVTGALGSLSTTSGSVSLYEYRPTGSVAGNFISNPLGNDPISWTPTGAEIGIYHYACTVPGHVGMVGQIAVVPEPSTFGLLVVGFSILGLRRRSSSRN